MSFTFTPTSKIKYTSFAKNNKGSIHEVYICSKSKISSCLKKASLSDSQKKVISSNKTYHTLDLENGPTTFCELSVEKMSYHLDPSEFSYARDNAANIFQDITKRNSKKIRLHFEGATDSEIMGTIVGLELSFYSYKFSAPSLEIETFKNGKILNKALKEKSIALAASMNQARHLVNLPPNFLTPTKFASELSKLFKSKYFKVDVLDEKKLKALKCNLILAVGMASKSLPRIVHLKYRPTGAKNKPIAFVGKGITFDTGGLNMKSGGSMRLMKKDMGGAATLTGTALWVKNQMPKKNLDFYFAIAENAVDKDAYRPSDIVVGRSGVSVEIHNTDAEGRLVLADALALASEQKGKDAPAHIINVATLTGAGKVALGEDIASFFCEQDSLSEKIYKSAYKMGDPCWRMPFYSPYKEKLNSAFCDLQNSASGFAGSITAALFLKDHVGKVPLSHFDIYSWSSSNQPCMVQQGGNGQLVALFADFIGG